MGGWGAEWGEDLKRDAANVCSGLGREDEFVASSGYHGRLSGRPGISDGL